MSTDLAFDETYMNDSDRFDSTPKWFTARSIYTSASATPEDGDVYFDEGTNSFKEYNGTSWVAVSGGGGGGGASPLSVVTKTSAYTLTGSDDVVIVAADSAAFNLTLPTAVGVTKPFIVISKTANTNVVTIKTTASQTINGSATAQVGSIASAAPWDSVELISDGSNWYIA